MRRHSAWRPVIVVTLLAAAVILIPPLVSRTWASSSRDPTIDLNPSREHTEFAKYFPGQPWAVKLVELESLWGWNQGGPYGWTNKDRRTREVEVVNGRRTTLEVANPRVTVWMFGGSTAFGFGQRGDHTIASELVRLASERGVPIRVENFGVSGYVNAQETQVFEDQLAAGNRPDIAIFLDGANDTALGIERERYGLLDASVPYRQTMADDQRAALAVQAKARGYTSSDDLGVATRLAVGQYRSGVLRARQLGARYGVRVVHYWQPQLYTIPLDAPLVRDALAQWKISPDRHDRVGRAVADIARSSGTDPVDLTGIFDHVDGPIFYDTSHTNEQGALITAEAITTDLWPSIQATASG